jgi:putative transposase
MRTNHEYPTEKNHRLPREFYQGEVTTAFTLCVADKKPIFQDPAVVHDFVKILITTLENSNCIAPVYCFMPDHLHIILTGTQHYADLWKTIVSFKQKTGYWLSRNTSTARWQKDFYDHVIRSEKTIATQVRYILDNPVRKGIASSWQEYPHKGSIGCSLDGVLNGIM